MKLTEKLTFLTCLVASAPILHVSAQKLSEDVSKKNILFIVCDDLRPEMNCYGESHISSPHMDKFASESVLFERAYCNIPVSGASRASLLTGMRPTRSHFVAWNARVDVDAPQAITIQKCFKEAGYTTISNGKIFHHSDEASKLYWDEIMLPDNETPMGYHLKENIEQMERYATNRKLGRGLFYEHSDTPENEFLDWQIAEESIRDLNKLKDSDKPFFLAVGFIRPHLPFIVPEKYWNLYDHNKINLPDNFVLKDGHGISPKSFNNWSELRQYAGIPKQGQLDEETAKNMIHGYYASVSFVDAQVGRVLEALKETGLDKTTTVVLIGDHGWHLGEHGLWCKHTILDHCLHAAMMVRSPEKGFKPYRNKQIVEFVDLYPTLCDAAGIKAPKALEGESLVPMLMSSKKKSKGYAVARWANGFTLVKDQLFYTEWRDKNDKLIDSQLFDHSNDPEENYNVVNKPEYQKIVKKLSKILRSNRGAHYFE